MYILARSSDAGSICLANLLEHNTTLCELRLFNCQLTDPMALHFADRLRFNTTLRILNVSGNSIETAGILALSELLHPHSVLTVLDMGGNGGLDGAAEKIAEKIEHNHTITEIGINAMFARVFVDASNSNPLVIQGARRRIRAVCEASLLGLLMSVF